MAKTIAKTEKRVSRKGTIFQVITFSDNTSVLCWEADLYSLLSPGMLIEPETEVKTVGKDVFTYLTGFTVIDSPPKSDNEVKDKEGEKTEPGKTETNKALNRLIGKKRTEFSTEKPKDSDAKSIPAEPTEDSTFKNVEIKKWENPLYVVKDGFAPLSPNEIIVRASVTDENGSTFLLWSDPYNLERILNSKYGVTGWQRKYQEISNSVYCQILIKDGEEWITKEGGTDTSLYPEKGRAHNAAFERACRSMGLSDELWTSPDIYIPASRLNLERDSKGKFVVTNKIIVNDIEYDKGKNIVKLELSAGGKIVYKYPKYETKENQEDV